MTDFFLNYFSSFSRGQIILSIKLVMMLQTKIETIWTCKYFQEVHGTWCWTDLMRQTCLRSLKAFKGIKLRFNTVHTPTSKDCISLLQVYGGAQFVVCSVLAEQSQEIQRWPFKAILTLNISLLWPLYISFLASMPWSPTKPGLGQTDVSCFTGIYKAHFGLSGCFYQ